MRRTLSWNLASALLLAAAIAAVFGPAAQAPFVFDDGDSVVRNSSIVRLWPLVGNRETGGPLNPVKELPTSGRPLVNLSLAINYLFGQLDPTGYHVVNCVIHWLSAPLVAAVVRRILLLDYFGSRFQQSAEALGLAVALIWAVHPLVTETVEYVTQRTELLVSFFYLIVVYASLRYWDVVSRPSRGAWLVIAALSCLAGMASKEVMVTAPVVVLLLERTFIAGSFAGRALRRSWPLYMALACGWVLLAALNLRGPRAGSAGFGLGVGAHIWWMTQAEVLWMYLKLAIWPWPLAIHYGTPYLEMVAALPWLLATAALVVTTAILLWRRSAIGFVGAWVLIILSPTLCVPVVKEVAAERRMYLPLVGLMALVIVGGNWLIVRDRVRSSVTACASIVAVAVALAIPLGWLSHDRLHSYADELTLWTDTVEKQPDDPLAHFCLANVLTAENRNEQALAEFEAALALKDDYADARINRASVLIKLNRAAEAQSELREVLRSGTEYSGAYYNLGILTLKSGNRDEAVRCFEKAIELSPGQAEIRVQIGNVLSALGSPGDAVKFYEDAQRLKPGDARLENDLGHALAQLNRYEEAVCHFQAAVQLQPDWTEAEFNLATALSGLERANEAIVHFENTLRRAPKYAAAEYNLANALVMIGKETEAIDHFRKAIELKPSFVEAYANQALSLARLGKSADAIRIAEKAAALAAEQSNAELLTKICDWLTAYRAEHPNLSPDPN